MSKPLNKASITPIGPTRMNWDPMQPPMPRARPDVQPRPGWLPPARWIIVGVLAACALAAAATIAQAQVNEVPGTPGPGSRAQLVLRSDGLVLSFDGKVKLEITEDGTIEFSDSATIDLSPTMITSNSGFFYAWAWIKVGGQYRLIPTFSPPDAGGSQRPLAGSQQ